MNNETIEDLKVSLVAAASTAKERGTIRLIHAYKFIYSSSKEINAKLQSLASENLRHTTKIK